MLEPAREGVRRSKREHFKPLEWWRGERYVYGRTVGSGPVLVPQIKEIVRIPKEPPPQLGGSKRKRSRARSKSKTVEDGIYDIPPARPVENPEEGWDDATEAKCVVLHYTTQEEVTRSEFCSLKFYYQCGLLIRDTRNCMDSKDGGAKDGS